MTPIIPTRDGLIDGNRTPLRELVLWGGTGQAKVLAELIGYSGPPITAVFDNNPAVASPLVGVRVHVGTAGLESWLRGRDDLSSVGFLVAIGGDKGRDRLAIHSLLEARGLTSVIARHPTAFVAGSARVGTGTQVLAQSAVCAEARIGRVGIVNTGAVVDHDCVLGDGVHVCPGATLAGAVRVGDNVMIGTGAVVLPRIEIGDDAIVGAGAVVTRNVPAGCVVVGNPARVIRSANDEQVR